MLPQSMDLLDPGRQAVFKQLKSFADDYILAGGTAIMFQIGHRLSYDFDCFSQKEPGMFLPTKIKSIFGQDILVQLQTSEMITVQTKDAIEISFIWHPFPILRPVVKTGFIPLFHLDDLVAHKAYTVGRRNVWRDYVDLFFLLHEKFYTLDVVIKLATEKFKGEFNEKLFLGQLTYFKDVEIIEAAFIKHDFTAIEIQSFLELQVEDHLKGRLI